MGKPAKPKDKEVEELAPGLYVVGTPIGNLKDITLRAIETLKSVDVIACEDTRISQKLLNHYGISKPLISYHEHNKEERSHEIIRMIERGKRVALISDAGMPGISDPGFYIIREMRRHGLQVTVIPGPTAFVAALVVSGVRYRRLSNILTNNRQKVSSSLLLKVKHNGRNLRKRA